MVGVGTAAVREVVNDTAAGFGGSMAKSALKELFKDPVAVGKIPENLWNAYLNLTAGSSDSVYYKELPPARVALARRTSSATKRANERIAAEHLPEKHRRNDACRRLRVESLSHQETVTFGKHCAIILLSWNCEPALDTLRLATR